MSRRSLISCDWGTSTFRIRLLEGAGDDTLPSVVAERTDPGRGIACFAPGDSRLFSEYLAGQIEPLFNDAGLPPCPTPVWLSGMITSTLGWKQLPYACLPFRLDGSGAIVARETLASPCGAHRLFFVSGLRAADDVMRGEECELIGLFADPHIRDCFPASMVVLPGTHSKWIEIRDGAVTGFRTFLTGELFDVLSRHSILKHSVSPADSGADYGEEFRTGVLRAAADGLLACLFSVRARALLQGADPARNRAYLSGLLIGDELSHVRSRSPGSGPIVLCGASALSGLYLEAFDVLGMSGRVRVPPARRAGLAASLGHWQLNAQHEVIP